MLTITLRDLQWRAKRFGLGVAATALVFAMSLMMAGVVGGFRNEISRTVKAFSADRWVVLQGVSGPFTAGSPVSARDLARVAKTPGVKRAEPVVIFRHTAHDGGREVILNVIGAGPRGLLHPPLVEGRPIRRKGEAVVDELSGLPLGHRVKVGDRQFDIVGRIEGLTYYAATPVMNVSLADGRHLLYDDQPLATTILTRGVPAKPVKGLKVMTAEAVRKDLNKPMQGAVTTMQVVGVILAIVAMGIIALMTYLSGLDRLVDFAVFKAIGVSNGRLVAGLVVQVLLLAVVSAVIAAGIALALSPAFKLGVHLTAATFGGLLAVALVVGLIVSLVGVRQATRVDPALAFGRN